MPWSAEMKIFLDTGTFMKPQINNILPGIYEPVERSLSNKPLEKGCVARTNILGKKGRILQSRDLEGLFLRFPLKFRECTYFRKRGQMPQRSVLDHAFELESDGDKRAHNPNRDHNYQGQPQAAFLAVIQNGPPYYD